MVMYMIDDLEDTKEFNFDSDDSDFIMDIVEEKEVEDSRELVLEFIEGLENEDE